MINTDKQLIHTDITYKVRGCIFRVYNELGNGHKEQVYQKALENEFKKNSLVYSREQTLSVNYQGEKVGNYRPDFIIENSVIVEIKAVEFVPKSYEQQLLHYLKTTGYTLGLLVNFGAPKLLIKRLVWSNQRKSAPNL